jgi:diguanylate cyclase (GGDEF)-like protein/PAS domain S-box-containing protein
MKRVEPAMSEFPGLDVFRAVVDRIETGVYVVDVNQRIVYWNYGAEKVTGFLSQEMLGRPCGSNLVVEEIEHNPALCVHPCPLESGVGEHARREVVTYFRHRAGHVVWVRLWTMAVKNRAGDIVGAVKVFAERVQAAGLSEEEKAKPRPEDLDIETGLASRAATEVFLRGQIELSAKQRTPCGLILIRLDTLEEFQRGHGKEAGSAMLHEAARTLKDMMRRSDFLGRWDAGCFLAVLPGCGLAPLERVGARMKKAAGRVAISWWGDLLSVKVSAGAVVVEAGDTVETAEKRLNAAEDLELSLADGNGMGA